MNFERTAIPEVIVLTPRIFNDDRGAFFESFQQEKFNAFVGKEVQFVQDNESISKKGVVRGLHFQRPPFAQGKLVRVIQGSVLDVAVDMRKDAPTFGQHISVLLSAENKQQLWVPEGFAHGFVALEENTIFQYKCTNYYEPSAEQSLLWNDSSLKIDWQVEYPIVSEKDASAPSWNELISPF